MVNPVQHHFIISLLAVKKKDSFNFLHKTELITSSDFTVELKLLLLIHNIVLLLVPKLKLPNAPMI
jgi:hypothetical protein